MTMKKNPKYDRKSFGTPSQSPVKQSPVMPGPSVFKDKPEYKGDKTD